ncbi:hypothetical protein HPP92_002708 [Vanilla planifolia]|uniref:Uncharacterized protein n=1 Tax=Vanilla planifolia TaxID=51239 RepID=A0A835SAA8_VANPL|nr:hypothetical protein HPP92_002708 [Vanilla planifolia]
MARALSSSRALFAVLPNGIGAMICRGYSTAAAAKETAERHVMAEEKEAVITGKKEIEAASSESSGVTPWVPDPVTGYYRPAKVFREVDPAELRQKVLKEKI